MKTIKRLIKAIICAFALTFNYKLFYKSGFVSIINEKLIILRIILFVFLLTIVFLSLKEDTYCKYNRLLALLFGAFLLIGDSYRLYGTIKALFQIKMIPLSIIKYVGFYCLLLIIFSYLKKIIFYLKDKPDLKNNKIIILFNKHPLIFSIVVLFLAWSIYYIAFYPIILSPDPSNQIKQYFNEPTKYINYSIQLDPNVNITNHHPVFHTMLLGTCIRIGRLIINDNFGLFIYSLLQGSFMALTLSYTIVKLKQKNIKNRYLLLMLCIYAFVPMFPLYAINGNKDVYYSMFIIWLCMLIFDLLFNKSRKINLKILIKWFIVLLMLCLFRNNGIYLVAILFLFILFLKKEQWLKIFMVFISVIIIYLSYLNILLPALHVTGGSIRESMSIFFQQTSRFVIEHEDKLTEKDKDVINNIIDYDIIKKKYNPLLSDPIKNTYNKYATINDLQDYFKVWGKGLIISPVTYIDATLNNVYGYFDPGDVNWYIYVKYYPDITENNLVDYHFNSLSKLRNVLTIYAGGYPYLPIIGLISNIGVSSWIMIAYGIYLIMKRKYRYLIVLVPMYISILVCIASPANTYFRYAMPYVFATPFIVGTWFVADRKKLSK